MAVYYVRQSGADSNNGTSPATAWRTIGKALGAAGIASGDTVYVGAGVYREGVTVNMTSATAETKVIGDVDGSHTGDAGIVRWTAYLPDSRSVASMVQNLVLNGRDYLTFENIAFDGGINGNIVIASTLTSTNITFRNCTFASYGSFGGAAFSARIDQAAHWLIENCNFVGYGQNIRFQIDLNASADYDADIVIRNCIVATFHQVAAIELVAGGSGSFKGGGATVYNCTILSACANSGGAVHIGTANISTTYPLKVYNSYVCGSQRGLSANTSGQIVEDYNLIVAGTPRSNVTAGVHSRSSSSASVEAVFEIGQSERAGLRPRSWFTPIDLSPLLGWGNQAGGPSTDTFGRPRPNGGCRVVDSGQATAGANGTITDGGKAWGVNQHNGLTVKLTGGTGAGQTKQIVSNTATALTVSGNWHTNPDNTTTYEIYEGNASTSGKATAGAAGTMTDGNATWGTERWLGYTVEITAGTGSGQTRTIQSHTNTVLTLSSNWTTNPDNTSKYKIYMVSDSVVQPGIGALERGDSARRETTVVDSGTNAVSGFGAWTQDWVLPVDAASTTITLKSRFDANYGAGTKPQLKIVNGTECGVADATDTSTAVAGAWHTHSLNFTPTSKGYVTVRAVASAAVDGKVAFDSFTKT